MTPKIEFSSSGWTDPDGVMTTRDYAVKIDGQLAELDDQHTRELLLRLLLPLCSYFAGNP